MAEKDYATSEDDKCYRDECWLLNGHDGLHSYHPVMLPTSTDVPRDRPPANYAEARALLDDSLRDIPPCPTEERTRG